MKLYAISDNKNKYFSEAYTNPDTAKKELCLLDNLYPGAYHIEEIDLPFIGRSVCFVHVYYGFDYDILNGTIYDVEYASKIYACSDDAKQDPLWIAAKSRSIKSEDDFIITDAMIASKDFDDKAFSYGDCMGGKFNVKLKRIRVIKI